MKEKYKRLLTVSGAVFTALSIALALLAFIAIGVYASAEASMPRVNGVIPDGSRVPSRDNREGTSARPEASDLPEGTEGGMLEEEGGGVLGAVIAVVVVVAVILVVIALIPRKK